MGMGLGLVGVGRGKGFAGVRGGVRKKNGLCSI